jgi:hypothetical protein
MNITCSTGDAAFAVKAAEADEGQHQDDRRKAEDARACPRANQWMPGQWRVLRIIDLGRPSTSK